MKGLIIILGILILLSMSSAQIDNTLVLCQTSCLFTPVQTLKFQNYANVTWKPSIGYNLIIFKDYWKKDNLTITNMIINGQKIRWIATTNKFNKITT